MIDRDLPLPIPDADSQPYWDGLRARQLRLQQCRDCGQRQLYFRAMCRHCWSRRIELVQASGQGRIYSFTVVHQAANPALNAQTPFALALVDLIEGPRILTRIVGDPAAVAIGQSVAAVFEDIGEFTLLYFARE